MTLSEPPQSTAGYSDDVRTLTDQISDQVAEHLPMTVKELLLPLFVQAGCSECLRADSLGFWQVNGRRHWLPRFYFQRTQLKKSRIRLGIFAGIHGDEPAGILALMDFLRDLDQNPELGRHYELSVYPVCNPSGFSDRTRVNSSGLDLNREFWKHSTEPEVALLEAEIERKRFDGIIALHSDDTCCGFYGYARGHVIATQLLAPALAAAEAAQPRDNREIIDGFHAVDGIIQSAYDGILSAPPWQKPQPFEIILETPAHTHLSAQRSAFVLALNAILSEARHFITYGGEL